MRSEWMPLSASALVVGAMSLVFGALLNPSQAGESAGQTLAVVEQDGGRWVAMAVMYFFASVALTLGLPAVLSLFERRGRTLGLLGVGVFAIGAIGTCGYAMLMIFFRAIVVADAVKPADVRAVGDDAGLTYFLLAWVAGFYGGVALIAVALFVARSISRWVPVALLAFVAMLPVASDLGRVGVAVQVMLLAIAFTGIATSAVTTAHQTVLKSRPAFSA